MIIKINGNEHELTTKHWLFFLTAGFLGGILANIVKYLI